MNRRSFVRSAGHLRKLQKELDDPLELPPD